MKDKTKVILKDKNITKTIFLLSLPVMISNVLKSVHDLVDIYFISNLPLSKESIEAQVSAITLTNPVIQISNAIALGLMIAGTSIMSKHIGAKDESKAKMVSGQLFVLSFITGIVVNVILFFLTHPILHLMNIKIGTMLYENAYLYLRYRSFECIFLYVFYAFVATKQASGDTITPVIFNVVSIFINIVLTWLFLSRLHMTLDGAALATVISNAMIVPVCLILLRKKKNNPIRLEPKHLLFCKKVISDLFKVGFPATLSFVITSLAFIIINRLVVDFDSTTIYAIGIGNRINALLLLPTLSIGTIITTFVGQNMGAKQYERVKKGCILAMVLTIGITIVLGLVMYVLRDYLLSIFIKKSVSSDAFVLCKKFLLLLILGFPFMGCFQVWVGYFQGIGRTDLGLILSSIRLWIIRLPLLFIMIYRFHYGSFSVYYSMIISNAAVALLGIMMYQYVKIDATKINKTDKKLHYKEDKNGKKQHSFI